MKKKAVIIGAGIMGLTAAFELLKKGYQVTVYESGDRTGGMSAHFNFGGLDIERYYHFICKPDTPYFRMLRELGLQHTLKWNDTRMGYYYEGKLYNWGNPAALFAFPKLNMLSKFRYALHAFSSTKRCRWQALDHLDAVSWIKKWIGRAAYDVLWKNLFELKFHQYTHNLSAAWIWTRIKRVGLSRKNIFKEEMGYLEGGSKTLFTALEREIAELGGEIVLNTPVQMVESAKGQKQIRTARGEDHADIVISTIPLPYVPELFPSEKDNRYAEFKNIAVVCLVFKLKKSVTGNFWLNINDRQIDIPGIVEYSNLNPNTGSHIVYAPYYLPRTHPLFSKPDGFFTARVKGYLKRINPELGEDDIISARVFRYRYAQPICPPGYLDSLPDINRGNGIFIADTSHYYPEDRSVSESIRLAREIVGMAEHDA